LNKLDVNGNEVKKVIIKQHLIFKDARGYIGHGSLADFAMNFGDVTNIKGKFNIKRLDLIIIMIFSQKQNHL
jgi:hypothetical protein